MKNHTLALKWGTRITLPCEFILKTPISGALFTTRTTSVTWSERARTCFDRPALISEALLRMERGVYAQFAEVHIKYCKLAKLTDDELVIMSQLAELRGASCVIVQKIMRRHELLVG